METQFATYILSILNTNPFVVMSWGTHNIKAIKNGLAFDVQGFIFTGNVEVIYNEGADLFEIWLSSGDIRRKAEGDVYLDEVVNVIDRLVEKDCSQSEYIAKVNEAYQN